MSTSLSSSDESFLEQAIEISRRSLEDEGKTPFGAIVVINGQVIAEGTSSVLELRDPTAHAEVMALRNAGAALGRHLFEDGVMYASSEPCPMCLCACYWARLPRLVFGATSYDVATFGFEDLQLYREMSRSAEKRFLHEEAAEGTLREKAANILRSWAAAFPVQVEPKYSRRGFLPSRRAAPPRPAGVVDERHRLAALVA
jgi:guanine deaminase